MRATWVFLHTNKQEISMFYDTNIFSGSVVRSGHRIDIWKCKINWERTIKRLHDWAIYLATLHYGIPKKSSGQATRGILWKKKFLRIFKYSKKNICVGVSFNKIAVLNVCNFFIKRLQHKYISVNIAEFLRTSL